MNKLDINAELLAGVREAEAARRAERRRMAERSRAVREDLEIAPVAKGLDAPGPGAAGEVAE